MHQLRFPAQQFRAMPAPSGRARVGLFYCPASAIPSELMDWRDVNPREVNPRSATYKAIVSTLMEEPERFHERNRGITVVAKDVTFDEKRQEVVISLADKTQHGVVDGSHTLHAILEGQKLMSDEPWPAHVFIIAKTGIDPEQIAEVAANSRTIPSLRTTVTAIPSRSLDVKRESSVSSHARPRSRPERTHSRS